jgi:hypothetical protein
MNRCGNNLMCTGANEEIVSTFSRFGVEFVVIGGLAIAWHCTSRQADDMDLLVNPTEANSQRVSNALSALGLTGFGVNSFAKHGVQAQIKQHHYADIITPAKDGQTFKSIEADAVNGHLFKIPVRIASRESLVQLKREAIAMSDQGAEKHTRDIELLQSYAE